MIGTWWFLIFFSLFLYNFEIFHNKKGFLGSWFWGRMERPISEWEWVSFGLQTGCCSSPVGSCRDLPWAFHGVREWLCVTCWQAHGPAPMNIEWINESKKAQIVILLFLPLQWSPGGICRAGHYPSLLRRERRETQNGEYGQVVLAHHRVASGLVPRIPFTLWDTPSKLSWK